VAIGSEFKATLKGNMSVFDVHDVTGKVNAME
jgi:hypothetical protein